MPECVIKERMAEAMTFYSDDNEAVKMIEKECTMFRNDVVMLYRTRNKIVHSASIGDTMLPYYIRSASEFSRELIGHTMDQFFSKGNRSIEGIITALFSAYDLLLENIKQDGTKVALFEKD